MIARYAIQLIPRGDTEGDIDLYTRQIQLPTADDIRCYLQDLVARMCEMAATMDKESPEYPSRTVYLIAADTNNKTIEAELEKVCAKHDDVRVGKRFATVTEEIS